MHEERSEVAVRNLQRYLRQLSYHEPLTAPPIDGIFERDTENALREFQSSRGLPVTGIADETTWNTLYAAYRVSLAENTAPQSISVFPRFPKGFRMGEGSTGFVVAAVQYMLQELEVLYGGMRKVIPMGEYDRDTADAVQHFQSVNRLQETGEIDLLTWNLLADQYNWIFDNGTDDF